ncbi:MAG TPA: iron export ABC transporter permease subunit FetB [Candidatus Caenarcaniphilales bacterium]
MDSLIQLGPLDLALALGMIAIAIGLSAWQGLGLELSLAIAAGRTILQLTVVGFLLEFVFAWKNPAAILAVLTVMLTIAAIEARNRIGKKIAFILPLVWGSIFVSTALTLSYINLLIVQPEAWYDPRYVIPLTGIVLGNAMNGAALAGERLVRSIQTSRQEIETHLCLGASPQQAIAGYRKDALKAGLIPTINAMMVVGIVTLPGIITGQLLSGVSPLEAASYQILIMFMLAFATLITTLLITQGLYRQFFNEAAQLILP